MEDGSRILDDAHAVLQDARRPTLVVMSGHEVGLRRRLQSSAVLGRDPAGEVVLSDAGVSWRHAVVEDRGDAWAIVDLGSTNGTVVNGRRRGDAMLAHGDRVVLGRTILRFELQDPYDAAYDEQLQRLLDVDDLSGLYVRRRFDRELSRRMAESRAEGVPMALLMMDMDGVKAINDTYGHLYGAYVIGETGKVIAGVLHGRGIASRFGGDEFCTALPGCDVDAGAGVAEEIRRGVEDHAYMREGVRLRPGISIGVAGFPMDATDPVGLFQRADEALYRAKHGGRNRVSR